LVATSQTKIITKLLERRQIEADLRQMAAATSELAFRRQAQQIAAAGSQVIPTIVANLDEADARLLTAMGVVSTFLDREKVIQALRQAVLQSRLDDRGRIGAITILERFLGQAPDDLLLESLGDPKGAAVSSLERVLGRSKEEPAILVEYVEGLDRQEPDVVLAVVRALQGMAALEEGAEAARRDIEPLRMMAQDVRAEIAEAALRALGGIDSTEAVAALQTLIPISMPELQPLAKRLLRKQQFRGAPVSSLPRPQPGWRALASPPSGHGQQSLWFILGDPGVSQVRFLNVLLHDRAGAVEAVGHEQVLIQKLLPGRPVGHVHDVALPDGSGALLMLEIPFDLGRRLLLDALADNRETQIPVAGSLRLLSPWLWGAGGAGALPERQLPQGGVLAETDEATVRLLEHPAFGQWTLRSESMLRAVQSPGRDLEVSVWRLAAELFSNPEVGGIFGRRLKAMSEWLLLSGDEAASRLALAAARGVERSAVDHPFVQALIRRDLAWLLSGLRDSSQPG
jgi:hypothetical protein